jgi:protein TonB
MCNKNVLADCLVDGDFVAALRSRRDQRRALLLAIAVEAALLATLLVAPLASPGMLPRRVSLTPSPPFPGSPIQRNKAPGRSVNPKHDLNRKPSSVPIWQPRSIPIRVGSAPAVDSEDAPPLGPSTPGGIPESPGIPGSTSSIMDMGMGTPPPPSPPPAPRRVRSGGEVEQALLIHRVEPHYPALAQQMRLEGTVRLHAIIGIDGAVRDLEVESGHPLLAKAAWEAVRQWRYRPTRLNGEPVEVETTIAVVFELAR